MDDSNDTSIDDIADMPLLGGTPAETTSTANETTAEPVQPAVPSTTPTAAPTEGEPTPPTGEQGTETPASESTPSEPAPLTEGQTPPAQQAWIERQQAKQVADRNFNQAYNIPSREQLEQEELANGTDQRDAKLEALSRQLEIMDQRETIVNQTSQAISDSVLIQQDFGVFNTKSPDYDPDFAKEVADDYQKEANLEYDEANNLVLRADRGLYDYYQQRYNSYNRGLSRGQQKAQANTDQMIARTENPGGSSSKTTSDLSPEEFVAQYGDMPLF